MRRRTGGWATRTALGFLGAEIPAFLRSAVSVRFNFFLQKIEDVCSQKYPHLPDASPRQVTLAGELHDGLRICSEQGADLD